jgi:hypothetical protein
MSEEKKKTVEERAENAGKVVGKEVKKGAEKVTEVAKAFGKGVKQGMEKTGGALEKDAKIRVDKTEKVIKSGVKKAKKKVKKK